MALLESTGSFRRCRQKHWTPVGGNCGEGFSGQRQRLVQSSALLVEVEAQAFVLDCCQPASGPVGDPVGGPVGGSLPASRWAGSTTRGWHVTVRSLPSQLWRCDESPGRTMRLRAGRQLASREALGG